MRRRPLRAQLKNPVLAQRKPFNILQLEARNESHACVILSSSLRIDGTYPIHYVITVQNLRVTNRLWNPSVKVLGHDVVTSHKRLLWSSAVTCKQFCRLLLLGYNGHREHESYVIAWKLLPCTLMMLRVTPHRGHQCAIVVWGTNVLVACW